MMQGGDWGLEARAYRGGGRVRKIVVACHELNDGCVEIARPEDKIFGNKTNFS